MLKYLLFIFLTAFMFVIVKGIGDNMIAKGVWDVISIRGCDDPDQYSFKVGVQKHKLTRKLDAFNSQWNFPEAVDGSYGVNMTTCKHVDGGCKAYQNMADDNVINFVKKVAEENLKAVLKLIDFEDFPIPPGEHDIIMYEFDKCELPCQNILGLYDTKCELLKDNEAVACVMVTVDFREPESEEEICDKCKE